MIYLQAEVVKGMSGNFKLLITGKIGAPSMLGIECSDRFYDFILLRDTSFMIFCMSLKKPNKDCKC